MSAPLKPRDHLVGALVLAMATWMGILGTPVFDQMKEDWYATEKHRNSLRRQVGPFASVGFAAVAFNNHVRRPIAKVLSPLQQPLGIGQSWYLYLDGPSRISRAHISVDGKLVGRSSDSDYPWLSNKTDYRRMRPFMSAICKSKKTKYWRGTMRWIVREAQADFPGVSRVDLVCTVQAHPEADGADTPEEVRWKYWSEAPDWEPDREKGESASHDDEDGPDEADEEEL